MWTDDGQVSHAHTHAPPTDTLIPCGDTQSQPHLHVFGPTLKKTFEVVSQLQTFSFNLRGVAEVWHLPFRFQPFLCRLSPFSWAQKSFGCLSAKYGTGLHNALRRAYKIRRRSWWLLKRSFIMRSQGREGHMLGYQ